MRYTTIFFFYLFQGWFSVTDLLLILLAIKIVRFTLYSAKYRLAPDLELMYTMNIDFFSKHIFLRNRNAAKFLVTFQGDPGSPPPFREKLHVFIAINAFQGKIWHSNKNGNKKNKPPPLLFYNTSSFIIPTKILYYVRCINRVVHILVAYRRDRHQLVHLV